MPRVSDEEAKAIDARIAEACEALRVPASGANSRQVGGDHYKKMSIEHWDYVLANKIPYLEAQIIKYVTRWRAKGGLEDLHKARHFLDKLIEYEEEQERKAGSP